LLSGGRCPAIDNVVHQITPRVNFETDPLLTWLFPQRCPPLVERRNGITGDHGFVTIEMTIS
jgi:hypothetical protein